MTRFDTPAAQAMFWYVSEEKTEPRLGIRADEPGSDHEQPLAIARDIAVLGQALRDIAPEDRVAGLLRLRPDLRHSVRRVQQSAEQPYAEIQDNLIDGSVRPIDLLRCKLSFFGARHFDPKSDLWLRIAMFQNAPYPDELPSLDPDDWVFADPAGDKG